MIFTSLTFHTGGQNGQQLECEWKDEPGVISFSLKRRIWSVGEPLDITLQYIPSGPSPFQFFTLQIAIL